MDLRKISWLGFAHSEVQQSGIVVHLRKETANAAHLNLRVPIVLHDGVALLEVFCLFDNIVCIAWFCIFGIALGGLSVRILPLPSPVRDANGESDPGKGSKDHSAVLNMRPFLAIQVEGPQVTVNEQVQSGLQLRKSGRCGIANHQCVEPSNLSEMYSKDALKTTIE